MAVGMILMSKAFFFFYRIILPAYFTSTGQAVCLLVSRV